MRIPFDKACKTLAAIFEDLGFESAKAEKCALIFTQNTCDGVASHGLNRFPRFVRSVKEGRVNITAEPELVACFGAMEQWDGNKGIGPLNAQKAMDRAIELSRNHGIGCVGLKNTNHWLRAGTYGLQAALAGCIGISWTNTRALMPPWGSSEKKIGNNPMAVAVPGKDAPVLLDMAMSQFSNGKLEVLKRRGEQLPQAGGFDSQGNLTTDPGAILSSQRALPIGFWKGSGLAVVLDLMASLMAGGDATCEISRRGPYDTGVCQVFIAVDIQSRIGAQKTDEKVSTVLGDLLGAKAANEKEQIRYPGQAMPDRQQENLKKGIPVEPDLWKEIQNLKPTKK